MDPDAITVKFRELCLVRIRDTALKQLWPIRRTLLRLGELSQSQAVGGAVVARHLANEIS